MLARRSATGPARHTPATILAIACTVISLSTSAAMGQATPPEPPDAPDAASANPPAVAPPASVAVPAAAAPASQTDSIESGEVKLLLEIARQPGLELEQRRKLMSMLLARDEAAIDRALLNDLTPGSDADVVRAICQAIAEKPVQPPGVFASPLYALLGAVEDAELQRDVAGAMGRYQSPSYTQQLLRVALSPDTPPAFRRGAVYTITHYRTREAAQTLITLATGQLATPELVIDAAFEGLADLTGMRDLGKDAQAWQVWWNQHKHLSETQWMPSLVEQFAEANLQLVNQQQQLQRRLIAAQRQLYRATPEADRQVMLRDWLADPLPATRQLAMDLTSQIRVDGDEIGPMLREAIVVRMDDPLPRLREQAARLLRELVDPVGAMNAANRIAQGQEQNPDVLREYLRYVARIPQRAAIEPALELLDQPQLQGEAAAVLAAAGDQDLLPDDLAQQAASKVRLVLEPTTTPDPRIITLLGRVSRQPQDWQRIEAWLDSDDESVKAAAARAWADAEHRSLEVLADRASDAVIQPIVIASATRRGQSPATFKSLVAHRPAQAQAAAAWRRALAAMAGRIAFAAGAAVLEGQAALAEQGEPLDFQQQLLTAAIDSLTGRGQETVNLSPTTTASDAASPASPTPDTGPGVTSNPTTQPPPAATTAFPTDPARQSLLIDLLLARAKVKLAAGDAPGTVAEFHRIESLPVTRNADQQQNLNLGRVQASLLVNDLTAAQEFASQIVGPTTVVDRDLDALARVAQVFLDAGERALAARRYDRVESIVIALRKLLGPNVTAGIRQAMADLQVRTEAAANGDPPS